MECVLGVALAPTSVRMVLVEGAAADGATVDHDSVDAAVIDGPEELISAIVGTRETAVAGGHRLITTGVAWTDRVSAALLRKALRARCVEDVVFVSELQAAGALAQAVGRKVGYERTALMFLESDTAALSVVDTATGAVVGVQTRRLQSADAMADLREMVASLERLSEQPGAVFIVGAGIDVSEAKTHMSTVTTLPILAPDDADLALARGAALAAAQAPRYEATTVGLSQTSNGDDTGALATQLADAGYMAPLGYSLVDDDIDDDFLDNLDDDPEDVDSAVDDEGRKPFLLVGSALTTVFVVGVVALVISLAVSIRPAAEQRPSPTQNGTQGTQSAGLATPQPPSAAQAPQVETIQEPVPVVQQAPRTVYVTPPPRAPAPVAAPAPVVAPAPAAPAPVPEVQGPAVPAAPVLPAAPAPPVVIPVPVFIPPVSVVPPQLLPPILRPRSPGNGIGQPYPGSPSAQDPTQSSSPTPAAPTETSSPQTQVPQTQVPQTQVPQTVAEVPTQPETPSAAQTAAQVPPASSSSSGSSSSGSSSSGSSSSGSSSSGSSSSTLWPSLGGR